MNTNQVGVSPETAAELTELSPRSIYRALRDTEHPLPSAKVGRRRVILLDELRAWLQARAAQ